VKKFAHHRRSLEERFVLLDRKLLGRLPYTLIRSATAYSGSSPLGAF